MKLRSTQHRFFSLLFLRCTWSGSSLICHANAPVTLIHMPFELRENSNCYLGFEETHQQFKIRCLLNIFKWNVETSVQGTSICQRNQKSSLAAQRPRKRQSDKSDGEKKQPKTVPIDFNDFHLLCTSHVAPFIFPPDKFLKISKSFFCLLGQCSHRFRSTSIQNVI